MADIPGVRITMDTNAERAMTVTLQNRMFFKFKECDSGLYFYDTEKKIDKSEEINNNNNSNIINYYCLQIIKEDENLLTKEEIARASKERRYQSILFWTSTTSYINIGWNNMITTCDINSDDIDRADVIWAPAESVLQCKMGFFLNTHTRIPKLTLPLSISKQHKRIII